MRPASTNCARQGAIRVTPRLVAWPTFNGTGLWAVGPVDDRASLWLAQGLDGVRERLWGVRWS